MTQPRRLVPATISVPAASARRWAGAFQSRFFLAILLGLAWVGPAWWNHRILYALPAWDALVLAAWLIDLRRLPSPADLTVARTWVQPPSLNLDSQVVLEISNRAAVSIEITVEDDVPAILRASLPRFTLKVPARGSAKATYTLHPTRRGDIEVNQVYLRYHGPVRFAERWVVANLEQTIRIYPNLREPERFTLYLVRSRQMEQERRLKRLRGRGREFESLREYRESDELRDVSWPASARHGKLISKVYQVERSQSVFLMVDAGRLMLARLRPADDPRAVAGRHQDVSAYAAPQSSATSLVDHSVETVAGLTRSTPLMKLDYAVNAALSLAHVALHSGDTTGLIAYGRKLQSFMPAARGAEHLRHLLERLALVSGEPLEANHTLAAHSLLTRHRRRSLVVWITDLAETAATPEVIEAASRLLSRHLVLMAVVGEPELRALATRRPNSTTEMYQYAAAQEVLHRRELLLRRMREQGALAMEFLPGQLSSEIVNQYLQIKSKGLL